MNRRINRLIKCGLILTSLVTASAVANEDRTKKDLSEVQNALEQSQAEYNAQRKKIASLQKNLKSHELDIAKNAKALNMAEQSVKETKTQQKELQNKADELDKKHTQFQKILAAQLKSAYMAGGDDYSKMLLNQEDTAKFERTLSYYNYLNKARIEQIEDLKDLQQQIVQNQEELVKTQEKLALLFDEQKRRQTALLNAQSERQANLKNLQAQLNSTKSSINYLKENQQTLVATIEELEKEKTQKIELLGLNKNKGKLDWPSKGKLEHTFGQRKHGGIDWKGVLIGAKEGTNINSVHNGQVVFADWLKGYGWVIVVDHGEGFMSLYGHAQTLLRDVGDMVREGETLALVGQSGGQASSGLYFEIRHKGRAVNPVKWCKRI
ncbi:MULTISPECIES: murein hydrolase activator EnvC family protein [Pseudoalteromonas]|uniref:Peptidoglycan DD-metalloendopeptidase family protein n=1 Tax=Pseudoalteromonas arctica TaxID=394751 RepID=A0AAP6Y0N5_9GAMM|nr:MULTISPECIES: peptidoglycan DD-metalloendopeptidase family protein [Pseudoalteromonas]MBH0019197.1 peptidoglycan DD-metalloendopeptidase family protein [Pseudoalteromonas sp. SWXJ133]MBH0080982.1 peptidoglycan DD-metalloendopeptidase family protein [Pseudoalteromonas sp. NZS11]NMP03023.1 peptidoglycan DD-metalloendopeptidase family protein [Pseudoalteromonas arctica]NMP80282.1 peptidoglycan DD-metalloendopeptidase family protein [Pseudoalteromonas arctica]PKH92468.1 protease [Pseudoalteromo